MTPNEKLKCIAEQAVYGDLKAIVNNHFNSDLIFSIDQHGVTLKYANGEYPLAGIDTVKPVLRPPSDTTRQITHKGYNDDEPFVPAAIINKMELGTYAINLGQDSLRPRRHIKENDLLHLWHFDTRTLIEKGEAIDVNTLSINPYEV